MGSIPVAIHGIHEIGPEGFSCALIEWPGKNRVVPIWLNPQDAMVMDLRLRGMQPRRPTTHDLLAELVEAAGGVSDIVIDSYHQGVFSATISLLNGSALDARASDALMLSAISYQPVAMTEEVLEQTALYLSPEDLKNYFGIDGLHAEDVHDDISASTSGDLQADQDFQDLMKSMGVTESDLTGKNKRNETDVTGESDDEGEEEKGSTSS